MRYSFAPGVSACLADGRLVLLNLPLDRYLMLPPAMEASVRRLLENEPDTPADPALRDRLCAHGLVLAANDGRAAALCASTPATESLLDDLRPPVFGRDTAAAAVRTIRAAAALRFAGLERSLRRVASIPVPRANDPPGVAREVGAFAGLRLTVRSLDRCLPLSLALAGTAKRRHDEVRLVLGVKCNPFGAHAWVQLGSAILNDRLDAVRGFTPILVV